MKINPDEEITRTESPQTRDQIAAEWVKDLKEIATSERPTRNIRPPVYWNNHDDEVTR